LFAGACFSVQLTSWVGNAVLQDELSLQRPGIGMALSSLFGALGAAFMAMVAGIFGAVFACVGGLVGGLRRGSRSKAVIYGTATTMAISILFVGIPALARGSVDWWDFAFIQGVICGATLAAALALTLVVGIEAGISRLTARPASSAAIEDPDYVEAEDRLLPAYLSDSDAGHRDGMTVKP
jgi:hypothetical protein